MREKRKMTPLKLFSRVFSALLAVLVLYIAGGMTVQKIRGEVFFFGNRTAVYVMSASMEPKIAAGSFIVVEKVNPDEVAVGDIVMFVSSDPSIKGQFNTHEVIEISEDGSVFYTKGLNNAVKDQYPPSQDDIRARYVKNADFLNRFFGWFLTKSGLILTLIAIAVLVGVTYLPGVIAALKVSPEQQKAQKAALMEERIKLEVERLKKEHEKSEKENDEKGGSR